MGQWRAMRDGRPHGDCQPAYRDPMAYTHGHHESVLRSHKWRTVDNSAAYLAPRLTSGSSVLDLGCGPGTITADIGRRVAPGRVLGKIGRASCRERGEMEVGGG